MRDGIRILDADRHVFEPVEMWKAYLPPAYRDRAPILVPPEIRETQGARIARLGPKGLIPPPPRMLLDGQPIMHKLSERAEIELTLTNQRRATELLEGMSPEGHLCAMDRAGVDIAFLYPTYAMYLVGMEGADPALVGALARAYNLWLRDFCSRDPERLRGVGLISLHDPGEMVPELERIVDFGWRAVVLRPNPTAGRLLGDPAYAPFWAACERHDIAVAIHEGTHARLPAAGADRFESRFALHACSHPMEQMMALLALIEGGVLERHPALRVAFLEAGCGWVPYWLFRLDAEYAQLAGEVAENVKRKPSDYFRRQCFVGFEPEEPYLLDVLRQIGEDKLLFGTDFPHMDHAGDILDEAMSLGGHLGGGALSRLLSGNAARFYGLTEADAERVAQQVIVNG